MERRSPGLVGAIRIDVVRLHETWMELLFPNQLDASRVLGKWKPESALEKVGYYLWAAFGALPVAVGYPLLLLGFATRYYAGRLDSAVTRYGVVGAVLAAVVAWGILTAVSLLQLHWDAFLAVAAASAVATVSAGLAAAFSKAGGRLTSVLFAYPFAMTALFLPPVVAALVTPTLGNVILPASYDLARWILNTFLSVGGINELLRGAFDLETFGEQWGLPGLGYVLMWLGISVPLGWFLGGLVGLADVVRPKPDA